MLQGRLVITWSHWSMMYRNYTYTTKSIHMYLHPMMPVLISQYTPAFLAELPLSSSPLPIFCSKPPTAAVAGVAQHPAHPLWIQWIQWVRPSSGRWCSRPSAAHPRHQPHGRRVWSPSSVGGGGKETKTREMIPKRRLIYHHDRHERGFSMILMYVCMYACMHVCMYACMYVCVYIYIYINRILCICNYRYKK